MPNMDETEIEVRKQIKKLVQVDAKPTDSLALIGLDSITLAELTFELEKSFAIRFDESIVSVETVGELIDYVREQTRGGVVN
jgi:acyl carrier protein